MHDLMVEKQAVDDIFALAASPHFEVDKLCYAAHQSGLRASQDGGLTWRSAFESLDADAPVSATAVAVSPDGGLFVGVPGSILVSNDAGSTWQATALPTPAPFITSFAISPDYQNDGVALAGSMEDGVFVTEDYGKSWNGWNFGLLDSNIFSIALSPDFVHDRCVFVGTESGIFVSKNRGRSWRANHFAADHAPVLSLTLSPTYALDGMIWAGTEARGLFYSEDGGDSWERIELTGSVNNLILSPQFPHSPDLLALVDDELLISRDCGHSWAAVKGSSPATGGVTAVIAPTGLGVGSVILLGSDEGTVITTKLTG